MTPAGLLLALALLVGTASPAGAESWRHRDARRDAVQIVRQDDGVTTEVDPTNRTADVTRIRVRHTHRRVLVDLHLRDLRLEWHKNVSVRLRTPGADYEAWGYQDDDDRGSVMLRRGERFVSCSITAAWFRPQRDLLRIRVPRTCLGDPRWVQVQASFATFDADEDTPSVVAHFEDVATADGTTGTPARWSPRLRPAPAPPPEPLTLEASYGWMDHRAVGGRMTDGLAVLEVGAPRGVVVERVRAAFDGGVRVLGTRFAPPDRNLGGALVRGWPPHGAAALGPSHTVPARGARLSPTGPRETWLLLIGYEVTEPGRHLRSTIRIDYRVGDRRLTVRSDTPALICAGRRLRERPCTLNDQESMVSAARGVVPVAPRVPN